MVLFLFIHSFKEDFSAVRFKDFVRFYAWCMVCTRTFEKLLIIETWNGFVERGRFREGGQLRRIEISFFTKASRKKGFNFSSKREGKFISRDGKDRTSVQLQAFQPLKRSE